MPVQLDTSQISKPPRNSRPVIPWYDHWSNHPSNGLTPQKLAALLVEAERGDMTAQSELYEDILDKEPTIFAALDTRKGAVLTKQWQLLPLPNVTESKAKKQIERIQNALDRVSVSSIANMPGLASEYMTFEDLRAYLLDATGRGFVAAAVDWDPKTYEPLAFRQFAQKHFIGADIRKEGNSKDYNPYELRLRTELAEVYGEDIKPHQFIFHFSRDKQGLPSRLGLLKTLAWWYLFANYSVKSMLKFSERYGMPLVIGKYDPNESAEVREVLETAVKGLGQDAAAVISSASEIVTMDAGPDRKGDIYQTIRHMVDMQISKAILGHSSTTESTPGKLGAEDQAMQVSSYRIERDAKALDDTINSQLIEPMAIWGEGKVLCYIKTRFEPEEDLNTKVDRYVKLIGANVPIGKKHIYETFDIPEPGEGEDVVTPAPSDPLTAAMLGGMGGQMANSRVIRNAVGRERSARLRRKQSAIDDTVQLVKRGMKQLPEAYQILVDGLPMDEGALDAIQDRTERFKAEFGKITEDLLKGALEISSREMLSPELLSSVKANKIDPSKFRNMNAVSWLDFQVFTLTEIEGETITLALQKRIKDMLVQFEAEGLTPKEFYSRVLDAEGVGSIGRGHLQTILRTNIATARSAGVEIAARESADAFPAWEFVAVNDSRTRDEHAELDGKVFPMTDKKYWPPLGFNCRCEASPIHRSELDEEGYELSAGNLQGIDVPKGFGTDSRVNYARWVDSERRKNPDLDARLSQTIGA